MNKIVKIGEYTCGRQHPFILIAGPCVIESRAIVLKIAKTLTDMTARLKIPFVFKASYDKANRTSVTSYRGPGIREGLKILQEVKDKFGIPVTTDVHSVEEVADAHKIVDVIQIPAFLCRQTDLILEAARTKKIVNVKKGQFLAPWDMHQVIQKIESAGNRKIILTERGTSFGYNNLVSDFRSLPIMRKTGYPVVFDASHSVQQPGGLGNVSGGKSEFIPLLARCAVASGVDGIFMEVHPRPEKALSDGPNMLPLQKLERLLIDLIAIDTVVKRAGHR